MPPKAKLFFRKVVNLAGCFFADVGDAGAGGIDFFEIVGGIDGAGACIISMVAASSIGPEAPRVWPMFPLRLLTGDVGAEDGGDGAGFGGVALGSAGGVGVDVADVGGGDIAIRRGRFSCS